MKTTNAATKMVDVLRYTSSKTTKARATAEAKAMLGQDGVLFAKVRRIDVVGAPVSFVAVVYSEMSPTVDVASLGDGFDVWCLSEDDIENGRKARVASEKRSVSRAKRLAHKSGLLATWG